MSQILRVYHNPRCSKSRQAIQFLEESGSQFEVVEYLKNVPNSAELTAIVKKLGISPFDLVRKGEEIFKTNYKGKTLSDKEWIQAMVDHPKLIERPIVVKGDKAVIGRPTEAIEVLF